MCLVNVSATFIADNGRATDGVGDLKTAMCGCTYIDVVLKNFRLHCRTYKKSQIDRTILAFGPIHAPPNDHRAASIGVDIDMYETFAISPR
jgi:hypothetical protein